MQIIKQESFKTINLASHNSSMDRGSFPKLNRDLSLDMYEKDGNMIIKINIPDVEVEKINISIKEGVLCISDFEKGDTYETKKISYRAFSRLISLPKHVNQEQIDAEYKDDVLTVMMPIIAEIEDYKTINLEI